MRARKELSGLLCFLYYFVGINGILVGIYALGLAYQPEPNPLQAIYDANFKLAIDLPLSGFTVPIYPFSTIMLGAFLMLYTRRYKTRGLPILLIGAGAFDLLAQRDFPIMVWSNQGYLLPPMLMLGGWLLAGAPNLKLAGWRFWAFVGSLMTLASTQFYHAYELCLFVWLYGAIIDHDTFAFG